MQILQRNALECFHFILLLCTYAMYINIRNITLYAHILLLYAHFFLLCAHHKKNYMQKKESIAISIHSITMCIWKCKHCQFNFIQLFDLCCCSDLSRTMGKLKRSIIPYDHIIAQTTLRLRKNRRGRKK